MAENNQSNNKIIDFISKFFFSIYTMSDRICVSKNIYFDKNISCLYSRGDVLGRLYIYKKIDNNKNIYYLLIQSRLIARNYAKFTPSELKRLANSLNEELAK